MSRKLILMMAFSAFLLTGCSFFLPSTTPSTLLTTSFSTTGTTTAVLTTISVTSESTTAAPTTRTTVTDATIFTNVTGNDAFLLESYETIQDALDSAGEVVSLPSTGSPKALVFAIDFSDHPAFASDMTLSDIETAFNGESAQTGYESVNSYYRKSSGYDGLGQGLNLMSDVHGFYRAKYPTYSYAADYETGNPASDLVLEVLDYYDSVIDYRQYDANGDGYIDALYLIYTAPISLDYGSDLWWAYMDTCVYYDQFDGIEPYYYVFAGTDFFRDSNLEIDSRTAIHETGHLLGLEDYYDYDEADVHGNSGGLGGADMMDSTIGDMNPFSKLLLGWITPTVITSSGTFTLPEYVENGDALLLIDEWNETIFDEYLLIAYYSPEGLYEEDQAGLFTISGVILYHIDARIDEGFDEDSAYWSIFNYNNTDTEHKLIQIVEADKNNRIAQYSDAEDSDLFQTGMTFDETYGGDYGWYRTDFAPMTFEISVGTVASSTISIHIIRS